MENVSVADRIVDRLHNCSGIFFYDRKKKGGEKMDNKEWQKALATGDLITALRVAGYTVETPCTGSVIIDGEEIFPDCWDFMAVYFDGTEESFEELGFSRGT